MLSFQGRPILIKSVICSMPIYNMSIYIWPSCIIKEAERVMRNFLWTGDPSSNRSTTVRWENTCKPVNEGGLGVHKLKDVNMAMLMKLAWSITNGEDDFA
ncbi:hypothetical protein IFM89_013798 [Coptis chinensis]|uniref:Uncharacterized protein n=1 Tax=Coptis chinensis TaxID=261450 RepID=A0A835HL14_9MAGN|nr:hypothetical protein IFM89_013798 [Coptis chinensis]